MVEVAYDTLTAYYDAFEGISVQVYVTSTLPSEDGNYVILRFESESIEPNNSAFMKNPVIILEVVTHFVNSVDPKIGWDIMNECMERIYGTQPGSSGIIMTKLYQIEDTGTTELIEGDINPLVHRLIKRFLNRTIQ